VRSPLRVAVSMSGGSSLGAYHAGAMAALLVAVGHLHSEEDLDVEIDVVGGASAGALVAMLSAYSLMEGVDPVRLLHQAWVDGVSLDLLRGREGTAPLEYEVLRERLPALLDPGAHGAEPYRESHRQPGGIVLHFALTGLQGLTFPVAGVRTDTPVTATTWADWKRFVLEPGGGPGQLVEPAGQAPVDAAIASAANPGGFAPRMLDRSADREAYEERGVSNFPDSGALWYTDGGLLQTQPLGRVMGAANLLDRDLPDDARRVVLMIDTHSEAPSSAARWSDPDFHPTWLEGVSRALAILPAQSLYDDLRRVEKANTRIGWTLQLVDALEDHLDENAAPALRDVLKEIAAARAGFRGDEPQRELDRDPGEGASARELLERCVREIAGLRGKEPVAIDVISPLVVAERKGKDVKQLLAGEFMGDFGGFLSWELRDSDFALGYESTIGWIAEALGELGPDADQVERTVAAIEARELRSWEDAQRGQAGLGDLPLRDRARLAAMAIGASHMFAARVLPLDRALPGPVRSAARWVRGRLR